MRRWWARSLVAAYGSRLVVVLRLLSWLVLLVALVLWLLAVES